MYQYLFRQLENKSRWFICPY